MIHTKFSACINLLFENMSIPDAIEKAVKHGFNAVDIWYPYQMSKSNLQDLIDSLALKIIFFNVDAGDQRAGEWGTGAIPTRKEHFRRSFMKSLEYAEFLGEPMIHVMSGKCIKDVTIEEHRDCYLENLHWAIGLLGGTNITLLIEPLNPIDIPNYFLTRIEDAASLLNDLNSERVKILCDIYHMQRSQGNLTERIVKYHPFIYHYHFADVPGRNDPGTGEINYQNIYKTILSTGYKKFIGLEFKPTRSIGETIDYIRKNQ